MDGIATMDGIARNTQELDGALVDVLLPVAAAVILALAAVVVLALAAEILRRAGIAVSTVRLLDRVVPAPARRSAAAVLSLTVTLIGPTPAYASDAPVRDWLTGTTTTTTTTTTTSPVATEETLTERVTPPTTAPPLPTLGAPDPIPIPIPVAPVPPLAPPSSVDGVVVVEGDCLWAIAAARLGPAATNLAIDAGWRAIYAMNRDAIGDDPNLIFPGQYLALPPIDPSPYAAP